MGTLIFLENLAGGTLIRVGSLIRHCIVGDVIEDKSNGTPPVPSDLA